MQYTKTKPHPALAPFVECYYHWEGFAADLLDVQSPPNGFCAIVFNAGAPYSCSQGSDTLTAVPLAFVSGQFTSNYRLHLRGAISSTAIVLRPATLHNCFNIRMSHLVNTRASLDILPALTRRRGSPK